MFWPGELDLNRKPEEPLNTLLVCGDAGQKKISMEGHYEEPCLITHYFNRQSIVRAIWYRYGVMERAKAEDLVDQIKIFYDERFEHGGYVNKLIKFDQPSIVRIWSDESCNYHLISWETDSEDSLGVTLVQLFVDPEVEYLSFDEGDI